MEEKKFYGMRNDYMFKAVMQEAEDVLRNLVAALLGIEEEMIDSCEIQNPIELGKSVDAKDCVLDIKLILNNKATINIELQMEDEGNWPERSLLYWSRAFDSIKTGEDYILLKPTYHIGILNFTLFKEAPEFYSEYRLLNVKTHEAYTDKMIIRILDLTNIDLASKDEEYLATWARVFKAKTMEELEQVAGSMEVMKHMVVTLANLSEEEKIRQQCEAREKYERGLRNSYKTGEINGKELGIELGKELGKEQGIELGKELAILDLVNEGILTKEEAEKKLGKPIG